MDPKKLVAALPPDALAAIQSVVADTVTASEANLVPAFKQVADAALASVDKHIESVDFGQSKSIVYGVVHALVARARYWLKGGDGLMPPAQK